MGVVSLWKLETCVDPVREAWDVSYLCRKVPFDCGDR